MNLLLSYEFNLIWNHTEESFIENKVDEIIFNQFNFNLICNYIGCQMTQLQTTIFKAAKNNYK